MNIFQLFNLAGGLALFLFGMEQMSSGLEKQAGHRMQSILEKLTSSPFKGFILGVLVTALIQSSSATTVMVIGFVNSGIMKLSQAISVIMGSNVGTTVTSWILSLTGIQGNSFFLEILKPKHFTPVLALVGVIFYMSGRQNRRRNTGLILIGFSVLMLGMETMSNAVKPLADVPEFTRLFTYFENPILGLLVGALLTAVIQSSSASIGILQALSSTGAITFGAAIPIILGQNIGTCATALLSSVGANRNAKRTAIVHLYFNIIGATVFLAGFYLINYFVQFSFLSETIGLTGIALVHTLFNVSATVMLLPFHRQLERLAVFTVKDDTKQEQFEMLDERLFATPALAVEQSRKMTSQMAATAQEAVLKAIQLFRMYDSTTANEVIDLEKQLDLYEDKIGSYLVLLSSQSLSTQDSYAISKLLYLIGDFERIGDHAANLHDAAEEMHDKKLSFSLDAELEMTVLATAVREIVEVAIHSVIESDAQSALLVEPLEEVIDELAVELKNRHIQRLQQGTCTIELGFILSDILGNYERIADHCSNIAVGIVQAQDNRLAQHAYAQQLEKDGEFFRSNFQRYKRKYAV